MGAEAAADDGQTRRRFVLLCGVLVALVAILVVTLVVKAEPRGELSSEAQQGCIDLGMSATEIEEDPDACLLAYWTPDRLEHTMELYRSWGEENGHGRWLGCEEHYCSLGDPLPELPAFPPRSDIRWWQKQALLTPGRETDLIESWGCVDHIYGECRELLALPTDVQASEATADDLSAEAREGCYELGMNAAEVEEDPQGCLLAYWTPERLEHTTALHDSWSDDGLDAFPLHEDRIWWSRQALEDPGRVTDMRKSWGCESPRFGECRLSSPGLPVELTLDER